MILRYKTLYFALINYYTTFSFTWLGRSEVGTDVKQGLLCQGQRCEYSPASQVDYDSPVSGEQCEWTVILDASQCKAFSICASRSVCAPRRVREIVLLNY